MTGGVSITRLVGYGTAALSNSTAFLWSALLGATIATNGQNISLFVNNAGYTTLNIVSNNFMTLSATNGGFSGIVTNPQLLIANGIVTGAVSLAEPPSSGSGGGATNTFATNSTWAVNATTITNHSISVSMAASNRLSAANSIVTVPFDTLDNYSGTNGFISWNGSSNITLLATGVWDGYLQVTFATANGTELQAVAAFTNNNTAQQVAVFSLKTPSTAPPIQASLITMYSFNATSGTVLSAGAFSGATQPNYTTNSIGKYTRWSVNYKGPISP